MRLISLCDDSEDKVWRLAVLVIVFERPSG